MAVSVSCKCGKSFKAKASLAGRTIPCPHCKAPISIPAESLEDADSTALPPAGELSPKNLNTGHQPVQDSNASSQPAGAPAEVLMTCSCGQQFKTQTQFAGQQVNCPSCAKLCLIPFSDPLGTGGVPLQMGGGSPPGMQPLPQFSSSSPTHKEPGKPKSADDQCPFPGRVIELVLPLFKDKSDPDSRRFSELTLNLFGVGYCIFWGAFAIVTLITLIQMNARLTVLLIAFISLIAAAVVLIFLHFATHSALTVSQSMMKNPIYKISSIRHLQIAATPLLLGGVGLLVWGVIAVFTSVNMADMQSTAIGGGIITIGLMLISIVLRSILNPSQLGVKIETSATSAETLLGINAVFTRSPLYGAQTLYPIAMAILSLASVLSIFAVLVKSMTFFMIVGVMLGVGLIGSVYPLIAYLVALSGLFSIELFQAIFEIRRNTSRL